MKYLFVTGKLAEPSLRHTLAELAPRAGFDYDVAVLNITVAALMTPAWIARRLEVPGGVEKIMLPGFCGGDLSPIQEKAALPVELGPKDLRDLPEHFGAKCQTDYGEYDIENPRRGQSRAANEFERHSLDGPSLSGVRGGCHRHRLQPR